MIDYLRGELAELTPTAAVVECGGVGFALSISLNTYTALQGKRQCKLFVYEAIREDAHQLFGFVDRAERSIFVSLISVSGIGGNTARVILSAFSPAELANTIRTENTSALKAVKGIGLKTAQRIIVDLKDKLKVDGLTDLPAEADAPVAPSNQVHDEAVAALTMLGFMPAPSRKVVADILREQPTASVEAVIKLALKRL